MIMIKTTFKLLSRLSPELTSGLALNLFQKTRSHGKRFRKRELSFYNNTGHFLAYYEQENVNCYEMGNPDNPTTLLVHGWDSNAGSMNDICLKLVRSGHHVIAIDLPAHGKSKLTRTNLTECSEAVKMVLMRLMPNPNLTIVSHSFGTAVVAYTLGNSHFSINKWVMLSAHNNMKEVFDEFKEFIGLNTKTYHQFLKKAERILSRPIQDISVNEHLHRINCPKILLLHDKMDKIIPFQNAIEINNDHDNVELFQLENTGHYKMLTNKLVIDKVVAFLKPKTPISSLNFEKIYA